MRNILKWISIFVLVLVLLFIFCPNFFFRVPQAARSGTLSLPALIDPVTVIYDEYAVPHVYAGNEHDLFYAAGYIMAAERLFQMDMTNRAIQGRLAEMNAGLVNADKYLRTWGFHRIGKELAEATDPEARQLVQWGCDGINYYIDTHRDRLPLEFRLAGHEPLYWDPSIAGGYERLMAEDLNLAWGAELIISRLMERLEPDLARDLFPGYPADGPVIASEATGGFLDTALGWLQDARGQLSKVLATTHGAGGSNSWVLASDRTATGKPLLANDPHLGFGQPHVWYEMHLVGGRFNVRGVCLPGIPFAVIGQNQHIAWGFTNVMTDDTDFYVEEIHPRDSTLYRYKDQWLPFTVHDETIRVKDGEPVPFRVRETVHGVIISDFHNIARQSDQPVAMRWTGQDITDDITPFLKLNLARNWDDFTAAARGYAIPGQNVVYADREGNIGWRPFVRLPIRKDAHQLRIRPGASGEYDWQGYVPFEEMPFLYNPAKGYIVTANNRVVGDDYPYYITHYWASPERAERIEEMLAGEEIHDMASFQAIQTDVKSVFATRVVPHLLAAYEEPSSLDDAPRAVADALELFHRWEYVMDVDAAEPLIFSAWVIKLMDAIYEDEMDQLDESYYATYRGAGYLSRINIVKLLNNENSPWWDDVTTPGVENKAVIIRRSFESALGELVEEHGSHPARWRWGKVHTLTHKHPLYTENAMGRFLNWWLGLNVGPNPFPGGKVTVNPGMFSSFQPYGVTAGASKRRIVDLADLDRSMNVIPTGQSGNPFSRHYSDQAEMFNRGEYRPAPLSREAVERDARSTLILQP